MLAIQQVGSLIPLVAQRVDVECHLLLVLLHHQLALLGRGITYLGVAHSLVIQELLQFFLVLVAHLDDDAGVLAEEQLHQVFSLHVVQIDLDAAFGIGESHLQQRGHQTARADVVACHYPAAVDEFLYGVEAIHEIVGVFHRGDIIAHLAQALGEGAAAQLHLVEAEVYMVEAGVFVVHDDGAYHLLHVGDFAARAHDDRARGDDFLTVGVLLCHGEGVLARGHVYPDGATEVAQRLHRAIQAGILALLRAARPHPVRGEAEALHAVGQGSPHDVGQCLGHGEHASCLRIGQSRLRGVTQRGGDTALSTVVQGHYATVGQRQLQGALRLLAGYLACHRAVYLVGQPVFAGHCLHLQHPLQVGLQLRLVIGDALVVTLHALVHHHRLG